MQTDPNSLEFKVLSVDEVNRLAERVLQARAMRAEGRPEAEISTIEPSMDEMKAVIQSLRAARGPIVAKKAAASKPARKQSLDDLLGI